MVPCITLCSNSVQSLLISSHRILQATITPALVYRKLNSHCPNPCIARFTVIAYNLYYLLFL